ncbi:sensor histidine kinase [Vibrio rhodolitus]|uniref:sensor histidine kinase n=1 Tax=Vibrio rhodolitus TaxID=2231649 RepID=UPI000E0C8671|nr:HAMP domain-containing sensor histidine kinase [Vibrio rhodolitus]
MAYTRRQSIRFWKNSLVRRFFLLSLLVASLPLLVTIVVYDRLTAGLVTEMATERSQQNLLQIKNSIYHYSRQHLHALEALSELPEITKLFESQQSSRHSSTTLSLIHFDIDRPEIYGALFFDANWQLVNALPGQSASGYPYWGKGEFDISPLSKQVFGSAYLIGPQLATPGKSAWYLMAQPVYASGSNPQLVGYLAFQLRLASLTYYLSANGYDETMLCPLASANQPCFDALGREVAKPSIVGATESITADWRLINSTRSEPLLAREHERLLVLLMAVLVLSLVTTFFYFLVKRVRRRVVPLIDVANAVSTGNWAAKIPVSGNDEISLLASAFNRMTSHLDSLMLARGEAERKAVWGEFATGIAHEIRNPLATIKVCVQTLSQDKAEDRELQSLMVGEIDRINQLISSLLNYARPPDPQTKQVQLANLVTRLASLIAPMAKERGVSVKLDDTCLQNQLCIEADENQLQQIVMNLLINGLEASQSGSEIQLAIEVTSNSVSLVVSDQGCGMTEQQISTISQPFYTTKTTGTGLGLSVSQRLAEMNQARLEFYSQPGMGTQAVLRFDRESLCESNS